MQFQFNPEFPDATDEQKWEQVRLWRNGQLLLSDWTQLEDATADKQAWAAYRQQLRDLTKTFTAPDDVVIPTPPSANT
jgi:hypothetical protein